MCLLPAFALMEVPNREAWEAEEESNRMQERTVTLLTLVKILPQ
jgi:hypothetical protein